MTHGKRGKPKGRGGNEGNIEEGRGNRRKKKHGKVVESSGERKGKGTIRWQMIWGDNTKGRGKHEGKIEGDGTWESRKAQNTKNISLQKMADETYWKTKQVNKINK